MEITLQENIVTDNLILHLDSWNSSSYSGSGSTWTDLSGNGNNATLVGGYSYNDKSLSYGDSGYANITDTSDFDFSGDFSLESWFYLTETPDSLVPSAIFASWASAFTSNDKIILFINSSGQIAFQINTATNTLIYPSTVSLNEWYHIVVSRVNGVIDIYLNGQRGTSLNYSSAVEPVLDMRIGGYEYRSDPLLQSFVGKIPVARIYKDKGLNEKEVQQNYINQKGRFFGQGSFTIDTRENIVTDGLELYLNAANKNSYPGSGTTWYDLGGNGNNTILESGTTYIDNSMFFDGVTNYATISNSIDAKTVLAFVKVAELDGDYTVYGPSVNGSDNWLGIDQNKVKFFGTESEDVNNFSLYGTTIIQQNVWHQIGCTIDGNTAKVYLNGKEENSITVGFTIASWLSDATIGKRFGGVDERYFPGSISNLQVYNQVLTAAEIQKNYIQGYSPGVLSIFSI